MFSSIRRVFGFIKVIESVTDISIIGIPADILSRDIAKMWSTNRINTYLFTHLGKNEVSFPKFFAVEIHYMLQQLHAKVTATSTKHAIRSILVGLEEDTWLSKLSETDGAFQSRMDYTRLSGMNVKLLDHQDSFIHAYDRFTQRYGLNGYLLAADPGTGKTLMGLAVAECVGADHTFVVSPHNAVQRVWVDTIQWAYKKPRSYWVAGGKEPYRGQSILITHYEALPKLLQAAATISPRNAAVIIDESHNFNEMKSLRTQSLLDLCKKTRSNNVLWSSGTPIKAMGYEMIPLLQSIDPLFTADVQRRFMGIFGNATDRALDILKNRIGKFSFHVSGDKVIHVDKHYETLDVQIPSGKEYTLDAIKTKMMAYIDERLTYYKKHFGDFEKAYKRGLDAFEEHMDEDQAKDFKRYRTIIKAVRKHYDPSAMKNDVAFANQFEKTVILPGIPDPSMRKAFKDSRSVVKYVKLKVLGEALGNILGKARARCHVDMVNAIDWQSIHDKAAKKIIVFSSFVSVVDAANVAISKLGYKTALVYGATSSNVASVVEGFARDPDTRFLLATYQSLSTAVPLTMADVTVFVNQPWRSFERDQAEARTARIGQDMPVRYISTYLDTGKYANISTRSKDILEWSRSQVDSMMPGSGEDVGAGKVIEGAMNLESLEAFGPAHPAFLSVFDEIASSYTSS